MAELKIVGAVEGEYKPSHSGVPEPFTVIQYLFRVHFPGFEAGQVPVVIPECGHAVDAFSFVSPLLLPEKVAHAARAYDFRTYLFFEVLCFVDMSWPLAWPETANCHEFQVVIKSAASAASPCANHVVG